MKGKITKKRLEGMLCKVMARQVERNPEYAMEIELHLKIILQAVTDALYDAAGKTPKSPRAQEYHWEQVEHKQTAWEYLVSERFEGHAHAVGLNPEYVLSLMRNMEVAA